MFSLLVHIVLWRVVMLKMKSSQVFLKVYIIGFGLFMGWNGAKFLGLPSLELWNIYNAFTQAPMKTQNETINMDYSTDNTTLADKLSKAIRILCLVQTTQPRHAYVVGYIWRTWGARCNKFIFASTKLEQNPTGLIGIEYPHPPIGINIWKNTKFSLQTVYHNYSEFFDWILVTADDTYVVLENVRYMLQTESPKTALVFDSSGAEATSLSRTYVLSKYTLGKLSDAFINSNCDDEGVSADEMENLAKCLSYTGANFGRNSDLMGRRYFLNHDIHTLLMQMLKFSDYQMIFSNHSLSWSNVSEKHMQAMDFFIYHARSYELKPYKQLVPKKPHSN